MRLYQILALILICGFGLQGCVGRFFPSPDLPTSEEVVQYSSDEMVLYRGPFDHIIVDDDLPKASLIDAINQSLTYLNRIPSQRVFMYGELEYTAAEVISSCLLFKSLLESDLEFNAFISELERRFYIFESSSNTSEQVLFTGYYEPIYPGSLTYSPEYTIPVYTLPDDLSVLPLDQFRESLKNRTIVYRLEDNRILPYYSRQEIMEEGVLAGKGLELAWMKNPVDLLFLQIQGSGILELPSKEKIKVAYAGANGHNYSSIGALLVEEEIMPLEDVSMQTIRDYLHNHEDDMYRVLFHNKSYTFFTRGDYDGHPKGSINVPLTPLRSVATDLNLFPKAAIGYIDTEVPEFDQKTWAYTGTKKISRFILNQDTGGAIKGPGRTDLFWGNGLLAEKSAGTMRSMGKLYFFIAKKDALVNEITQFQASD